MRLAEPGFRRGGTCVLILVLLEECQQNLFFRLGNIIRIRFHGHRRHLDRGRLRETLKVIPTLPRSRSEEANAKHVLNLQRRQLVPQELVELLGTNSEALDDTGQLRSLDPVFGHLPKEFIDGLVADHYAQLLGVLVQQPSVDHGPFGGQADRPLHHLHCPTGAAVGHDGLPSAAEEGAYRTSLGSQGSQVAFPKFPILRRGNHHGIGRGPAAHLFEHDWQKDKGPHGQEAEDGNHLFLVLAKYCKRASHRLIVLL